MTANEIRLLSELLAKKERAGSRAIAVTEPQVSVEAIVFTNPLGRFMAWEVR